MDGSVDPRIDYLLQAGHEQVQDVLPNSTAASQLRKRTRRISMRRTKTSRGLMKRQSSEKSDSIPDMSLARGSQSIGESICKFFEKKGHYFNKLRALCSLLYQSKAKMLVDCLIILAFVFCSTVVDFRAMQSRQGLSIRVSRENYTRFLYFQNAWFALSIVAGVLAKFDDNNKRDRVLQYLDGVDLVLVAMGFSKISFMSSLNILRVLRLLVYLNNHVDLEYVKEVFLLLRKSSVLVLSIIGVSVVCVLFVSMFLNTLINDEGASQRCRLLTAHGVYKIDESQKFICSRTDASYGCRAGTECLGTRAPEVQLRGIDANDVSSMQLGFDNYLFCLLFLFQVLTNDRWGSHFFTQINSQLSGLALILIYGLTVFLSLVIQGFLIASFLDTIVKVKKNDIFIRDDYKSLQNLGQGILNFIRYNTNYFKEKGLGSCLSKTFKYACFLLDPAKPVPKTIYHKGALSQAIYRLVFARLCVFLDLVFILVNVILVTVARTEPSPAANLERWSNGITWAFILVTGLKMLAVGWTKVVSSLSTSFDILVAVCCLSELAFLGQSISCCYIIRCFTFLRFLQPLKMPIQVRIFLKSAINFVSYMLAYAIIFLSFLLIVNPIAMELFSVEAYVGPGPVSDNDRYLEYLVSSTKIFLVSDWSSIMHRCSYYYGSLVSLYFVLQVLVAKFIVDNCFFSIFIYIYSDLYWQYIKEPEAKVVLGFDKSTEEKRRLLSRAPGGGGSPLLRKQAKLLDVAEEESQSESRQKSNSLVPKSKEAEALMQLSSALKLIKTVRQRRKRPGMLPPAIIRTSFTRMARNEDESSPLPGTMLFDSTKLRRPSIRNRSGIRANTLLNLFNQNQVPGSELLDAQENSAGSKKVSFAFDQLSKQVIERSAKLKPNAKILEVLPQLDKKYNKIIALPHSEKHSFAAIPTPRGTTPHPDLPGRAAAREDSLQPFRNPLTKLKVIKNLNYHKEMISFRNNNRILRMCASRLFLQASISMSVASVLNLAFSSRYSVCSKQVFVYLVYVSVWLTVGYFLVEASALLYLKISMKKRSLATAETRGKTVPKVDFEWSELVLLLGNFLNAVYFFDTCLGEHPMHYISYFVCCGNFLRLTSRITEFKKYFYVISKSMRFMLGNLLVFLVYALAVAVFCFAVLRDRLTYCRSAVYEAAVDKDCSLHEGVVSSYVVNYDSFQNALLLVYLVLERGQWFNVVSLSLSPSVPVVWLHRAAHAVFVLLSAQFMNFLLKGVAVGLCYINLEKFASIRMDKDVSFSKAQVEWIQTEEIFCELKLLRKISKSKSRIPQACERVKDSRAWNLLYFGSVLAGFVLCMTVTPRESGALGAARLGFNVLVTAVFNLDVLLSCQARSFKELFYEPELKGKILLAATCDCVLLLTRSAGFYPEVFFQVIYLHFFTIFRTGIKRVDRKSTIFMIYEVFVSHVGTYLTNSCFLVVVLLSLVYALGFVVADATARQRSHSPVQLAGVYLSWVFDNEWFELSKHFLDEAGVRSGVSNFFVSLFVYASLFFCKNIVTRLFCAVVIGSYKRSKSINEFVFDDVVAEQLMGAWLKHDPEGRGYIDAAHYIDFVANLPHPLRMKNEDFFRQCHKLQKEMEKCFGGSYPYTEEAFPLQQFDLKEREMGLFANFSNFSRPAYYKNEDGSLKLSVVQFFQFCRIYNLSVYPQNKKCFVHLKDVVSALAKIAIENRHAYGQDISYKSQTVETMLLDKWINSYPTLQKFWETAQRSKFDRNGLKCPKLDMVYFQAIATVQKITKRNQELNAVRLNLQQNQKLMAYREFEEDTNFKLAHFSELNAKVHSRHFYEDVLLKNTLKNNRGIRGRSKHFELKSLAHFLYEQQAVRPDRRRHSTVQRELFEKHPPIAASPRKIPSVESHDMKETVGNISNFDEIGLNRVNLNQPEVSVSEDIKDVDSSVYSGRSVRPETDDEQDTSK